MYDVDNILENDLDALMSRILYVQIRKPSSMYILNAEIRILYAFLVHLYVKMYIYFYEIIFLLLSLLFC